MEQLVALVPNLVELAISLGSALNQVLKTHGEEAASLAKKVEHLLIPVVQQLSEDSLKSSYIEAPLLDLKNLLTDIKSDVESLLAPESDRLTKLSKLAVRFQNRQEVSDQFADYEIQLNSLCMQILFLVGLATYKVVNKVLKTLEEPAHKTEFSDDISRLHQLSYPSTKFDQTGTARGNRLFSQMDSLLNMFYGTPSTAVTAGRVDQLKHLLINGTDGARGTAAGAIGYFASIESNRTLLLNADLLPLLVELLKSGTLVEQAQGAETIARLAGTLYQREDICTAGAVQLLVALTKSNTGFVKLSALIALRNLAVGFVVVTSLLNHGIVPLTLLSLNAASNDIKAAAAGLLRNLAFERFGRDQIHACREVRVTLLLLAAGGDERTMPVAAAAVWNLFAASNMRSSAQPEDTAAVLLKLLRSSSADDREDAARALWYLDNNHRARQKIIADGVIPILTSLLSDCRIDIRYQAAGALGHLSAVGTVEKEIVCAGAARALVQLLVRGPHEERISVIRTIKLLVDVEESKHVVIAAGAVPGLLNVLPSASQDESAVAREALHKMVLNAAAVQWNSFLSLLLQLLIECSAIDAASVARALQRELQTALSDEQLVAARTAIPALKCLLHEQDQESRTSAAAALGQMAEASSEARAKISCAQVFENLVKMLSGDEDEFGTACKALLQIGGSNVHHGCDVPTDAMPHLVDSVFRSTSAETRDNPVKLLCMMTKEQANGRAAHLAGAIPAMFHVLREQDSDADKQVKLLTALDSMARSDPKVCYAMKCMPRGVSYIIALSSSTDPDVRRAAVELRSSLGLLSRWYNYFPAWW